MSFKTVIICLLSGFLYAPCVCAEMLQGGVQMSDALPAVQPELRAGAAFNPANLPQAATVRGWYLIPPWAAGTWHRETMTYVTSQGEQTVLSKVNHFWGTASGFPGTDLATSQRALHGKGGNARVGGMEDSDRERTAQDYFQRNEDAF